MLFIENISKSVARNSPYRQTYCFITHDIVSRPNFNVTTHFYNKITTGVLSHFAEFNSQFRKRRSTFSVQGPTCDMLCNKITKI